MGNNNQLRREYTCADPTPLLSPDMEPGSMRQRKDRLGEKERLRIASLLFPKEQQRQELGEQVYPLVEKLAGPEAGLVTGMILTLDIDVVEQAVQEPEVLSRLVSSAVSRIEVCRQAKEKEKENLAGSDCGSLESEDSLSEGLVKVEEKELDVIGCGSSDDGSTL